MSDNQKVCSKVLQNLKKTMKGVPEKDLVVWAMMVSGIVLGKKAQLSEIAAEIPTAAQDKSTFRRLQRFVSNPLVDVQTHYMPFASHLLQALSGNRLLLAVDGSQVGRGCMTLMVGVVYFNRLLPLTWIVYKGKKGHASGQSHIQVLQQLLPLIPKDTRVVLLGDGEFDNIEMMEWMDENTNWDFVVRTAKNTLLWYDNKQIRFDTLAVKGAMAWENDIHFTAQQYGPLCAVVWWDKKHEEPLYLLTSLSDGKEACRLYKKRPLIETLFSDQKSRGFCIDKSHLSDPKKLNRLLMASSLAYIWMVWLGVEVLASGNKRYIDHNTRTDKSLFRLGIDWLRYTLKHGGDIRVSFFLSHLPKHSMGVM